MALVVTQMNRPDAALAAAVHFLARRAPFDAFAFGVMTLSLDAQIKRKSYLFAIDGNVVAGYVGWVMLDTARAEAFARENRTPRFDEAGGDDVLWLLVAAATSRGALMSMVEALRRRYPGKRVMGVRNKPGGKRILFDSTDRRTAP
jgi:hypothetical protein